MLYQHEESRKMNCKDCDFLVFEEYNISANRYYCKNTVAAAEAQAGTMMICRTDRQIVKNQNST